MHPESANRETPSELPAKTHFLVVIWQRKSLLLLGVIIGMALGLFYYSQQPKKYQSSAQMYVMKRRAEPLPMSGPDARVAFVEDYVATQEALMKSHEVLRRAASQLEGTALHQPPTGSDLVGFIAQGLTINRLKDAGTGGNSNVLTVSFRGPSSEDCAIVINAVMDGYRESLKGAVSTFTDENLDQVAKGLLDTKVKLDAAEKEFQEVHKNLRASEQLTVADLKSRINVNETKRAELVLRRIDVKSRLELITDNLKKGDGSKQDGATLLALFDLSSPGRKDRLQPESLSTATTPEGSLFALKLQEEELLQTLGRDHPQVIALRRRSELLRDHLQERDALQTGESGNKKIDYADPLVLLEKVLVKELESNQKQQKELDELLTKDRGAAKSLDEHVVTEMLMRERTDRLRKQYDNYTERQQQINLTRDAPLFDARVITPAGPGGKISPILFQFLAIGGFAGLLFGGGLAYLAEITDKSYRSVEEVRRRLGLSIIGQVSRLVSPDKTQLQLPSLDPLLVTVHSPKTVDAEAFRGLRTSLYFSTRGKGHQVLQITSPTGSDGKSTITANLAVAMAQSGKKVILLDADFRRPRVHKIFGLPAEGHGLASVIAGESTLEAAVQPTLIPNLSALTCGTRPTNPAELLTSSIFQEVLEEIKKHYDLVLIDTPPLLAVSDPAVVAPRVDGVILVLRLGRFARPQAERAKDILTTLGAKMLGVVVNFVEDQKENSYRYGYGYGYGYSYGYSNEYISEQNGNGKKKREKKVATTS